MNEFTFEAGRIVISKQGRDKERLFVVYEVVNNEFVLLVDGDLRKIEKPKLKKTKHLKASPYIANDFLRKLNNKMNILDSDIRTELEQYREVY